MPKKQTPKRTSPIGESRLKFYDEEKTGGIRKVLEKEMLEWPGVSKRPMMGCLCYFHGSKFFAFLVTKGIVITKLSEADRSELSNRMNGRPFEMSGRTAKTWVKVGLNRSEDAETVLPYVKKSYMAASA